MDVVVDNVKEGNSELTKYYETIVHNRGFILKLFGVLVFVILLFAIARRK